VTANYKFTELKCIVHRVPKKHVTTFSTITLTVSVQFQ